jgi:exosortase/archaeosortase family protein
VTAATVQHRPPTAGGRPVARSEAPALAGQQPGQHRGGGRTLRGAARRRWVVVVELLLAAATCEAGFHWGARWMQDREASWVAAALRLVGADSVSGVLPGHILLFRGGQVLDAEVTASCSSILSLLGLTALTVAVLRSRRLHAAWGLAVAGVALVVANDVRLGASAMAGLWWGGPALVLFHDWVGTVWNFAATLGGFLLMVALTLPESRRAEQDVAGRHTADRPTSWARPGLGYRAPEREDDARRGGRSLTGLFYRYVLPRAVTRRLAARREAGRIDYRLGHLSPGLRAVRVRSLAADGLGVHTATLLAVATYDTDPEVLDALADAVAARQWEPVTSQRVAALRLWARGWALSRVVRSAPRRPDTPPAGRAPQPATRGRAARPLRPPPPLPLQAMPTVPLPLVAAHPARPAPSRSDPNTTEAPR